jgi:hypothetical protein
MVAARRVLSGWLAKLWRGRYILAYAALAAAVPVAMREAYHPRTGFSSLIWFGDRFAAQRVQSLRDVPLYTFEQWDGYDGQFYAQVAVAGNPLNRELGTALDSAGYRARRVLLPVAAHLLGVGRPGWIVQIYALASALCWLLLAWLLARWWFPPTDFGNLLRWAGTLFGTGALVGVMRGLTDVPALLVIAVGARAIEQHRPRAGALWLAAAGLVRETSILAAAALWPGDGTAQRRRRALVAVALIVAPTALWIAILAWRYGGDTAGARNFAPPLAAIAGKARVVAAAWRVHGFTAGIRGEVWAVMALLTQVGFMIARPRPRELWWRLGAPFAALVLVLGPAVWEGEPSAATRAVLPLTLAFNVLVPRTRRGLVLLLAGNLTLLSATFNLRVPSSEQTVFTRGVTASYQGGWHSLERLDGRTWRWASGDGPAVLRMHNPNAEPVPVTLDFGLRSVAERRVSIRAPGRDERIEVPPDHRVAVRFGPFTLPPGDADVTFESAEPPWREPGDGARGLTMSVEELYAEVPAAVR